MYTVAPIYRDKELVRAALATLGFTLFTWALCSVAFYFSREWVSLVLPAMAMAPVIRSYASDVASEYQGYRVRVLGAAEARARHAAYQARVSQ